MLRQALLYVIEETDDSDEPVLPNGQMTFRANCSPDVFDLMEPFVLVAAEKGKGLFLGPDREEDAAKTGIDETWELQFFEDEDDHAMFGILYRSEIVLSVSASWTAKGHFTGHNRLGGFMPTLEVHVPPGEKPPTESDAAEMARKFVGELGDTMIVKGREEANGRRMLTGLQRSIVKSSVHYICFILAKRRGVEIEGMAVPEEAPCGG